MARIGVEAAAIELEHTSPEARFRLGEECLELSATTPEEITVLRTWVRRVNGPAYPQPFLVEGPPGHFRLYVGDAAERVRTARGIQ